MFDTLIPSGFEYIVCGYRQSMRISPWLASSPIYIHPPHSFPCTAATTLMTTTNENIDYSPDVSATRWFQRIDDGYH